MLRGLDYKGFGVFGDLGGALWRKRGGEMRSIWWGGEECEGLEFCFFFEFGSFNCFGVWGMLEFEEIIGGLGDFKKFWKLLKVFRILKFLGVWGFLEVIGRLWVLEHFWRFCSFWGMDLFESY